MALGVAPIVSNARIIFPWPGASTDLDFVRRQYFWNGATRLESAFTTFTLNSATFVATGLDLSGATAPDITISLASLGFAGPPLAYATSYFLSSTPGAIRTYWQIDSGANTNRILFQVTTIPVASLQTISGNVVQSAHTPVGTGATAVRHGIACSVQTDDVELAANGTDAVADTLATMPIGLTTLRIGKNLTAATNPPGILSRLLIFTAVKTQADLNQLSTQIRDTP
jgi:hypothetical protein